MKNYIFSLVVLFSLVTLSASAKPEKPKYRKYTALLEASKGAMFRVSQLSTYSVVFITPEHRRNSLEYYNYMAEKRSAEQRKKFKNKPKKLARELEEHKYTAIDLADWDKSENIVLVALPLRKIVEKTIGFGTKEFSNPKPIEAAIIVDDDFNLVCEPKSSKNLGISAHEYVMNLYGNVRFAGFNAISPTLVDFSLPAMAFEFDPNCLMGKEASVLIKNFNAQAPDEEINSSLKKVIAKDFGIEYEK